jgi:hypothetical protein
MEGMYIETVLFLYSDVFKFMPSLEILLKKTIFLQ